MPNQRLASIDTLRALTMVLMIWVNDFWKLSGVPKWLEHANWDEDYLGFSDIIFPMFLFIVGMSIPLAIDQRKSKGTTDLSIAKHILIRSASLLVIGFFIVNYGSMHDASLPFGRLWFCLLMVSAFALIWMHWKGSPVPKKLHLPLQILGWLILVGLAVIYKGGENGELWMTIQWWGILGLIGWAYLVNSLGYVLFKGNFALLIGLFAVFTGLSILCFTVGLPELPSALSFLNPVYTGTTPAFTAAGMITTLMIQKLSKTHYKWTIASLVTFGASTITFGLLTRPIWGISKIQGTPSWLGITTGISLLLLALLYIITDIKKQTKWAKVIAPAGTATLTCYILPYIFDSLRDITGIQLPDSLNAGIIGLITSMIFSLLIVILTGLVEKRGFKLKL